MSIRCLTSRAQAQPPSGTLNVMMTNKFHKSIATGRGSGCCLQRIVRCHDSLFTISSCRNNDSTAIPILTKRMRRRNHPISENGIEIIKVTNWPSCAARISNPSIAKFQTPATAHQTNSANHPIRRRDQDSVSGWSLVCAIFIRLKNRTVIPHPRTTNTTDTIMQINDELSRVVARR